MCIRARRLDEVNHLKSKYGSTIPDVLLALEEKQERLMQLKDYDTYLAGLKEEIARTKKVLEKQSSEVSAMRKEAAERLTAAVTQALLDLNFLDVRFTMNFERMAEYTANGFDLSLIHIYLPGWVPHGGCLPGFKARGHEFPQQDSGLRR